MKETTMFAIIGVAFLGLTAVVTVSDKLFPSPCNEETLDLDSTFGRKQCSNGAHLTIEGSHGVCRCPSFVSADAGADGG